jgi:rhodanese-related sulfurtransferase
MLLKTLLSHSIPEVTVDQVRAIKQCILLDAREHSEYAVSHISDAYFIGYNKFHIDSVKWLNKNARILIYCSIGYRSEKIAEKLKSEGFTDVSNLYGGIFEWVNQGNAVVDSTGKQTDRIHGYTKAWGIWLNKGKVVYQ